MAEYWLERRLTAILAADVLGPLWLMILRGENFVSTVAESTDLFSRPLATA